MKERQKSVKSAVDGILNNIEFFKERSSSEPEELNMLVTADYIEEEQKGILDVYVTNTKFNGQIYLQAVEGFNNSYEEFKQVIYPSFVHALETEYSQSNIVTPADDEFLCDL